MFEKLFKPKIEHPDPVRRLEAILKLKSNDQDISRLCQIVLNDADNDVRQQALKHLSNNLSDQSKIDSNVAAQLVDHADQAMKEKLIVYINDENVLNEIICKSNDQQDLLIFACKAHFPSVRKQAALKIETHDLLKTLQQRSSDKNVLKIARQKIADIKEHQRLDLQAKEELKAICQATQRLASLEYSPMMSSRLNLLQERWLKVKDEHKKDYLDTYEQALNECRQRINLETERAALEEFETAQTQLCESICLTLETDIEQLSYANLKQWPNKIKQTQQHWLATTESFNPQASVNERFHTVLAVAEKMDTIVEQLQSIVEQEDFAQLNMEQLSEHEQQYFSLVKQMSWAYSMKQPELYQQVRANHQQLKSLLKQKRKALKDQQAKINQKVTILKSHIRQKNLIKANRLLNYVGNLISELPEQIQHQEQGRLEAVVSSLNELRGLNRFITQPKKEELCVQMEALIQSKLKPEKLMVEIKHLQDKWKSLATSDADADDILWERFKQAADTAYLPCAAYIENLEQVKKDNLVARKQLVEQLEQKLSDFDSTQAHWKQVQSMYSKYWQDWRSLLPVFYSENKPVQKKFEAQMDLIKEKLDSEKNENHQIYDQLIEKTSTLVDSLTDENIEQSIEQIKRIQASWRNVGITHFKKSRKQWNRFRLLCDQVFDYQRGIHKAINSQRKLQTDHAYQIINSIKQLKQLPDVQLVSSQDDFQSLCEQFQSITDLPDNRMEKLQGQYESACEQYQSHLAGIGERNRINAHLGIRQAARLCWQIEELADETDKQEQILKLKSEFETLSIPKEVAEKLNFRIDQAALNPNQHSENLSDELKANKRRLNQIIIELEVMFDLETPDSAKPQRMQYQLEQLQSGLKPALSQDQKMKLLKEHELDWYQVGVIDFQARKQLEARLIAVIKQAET